MRDNFKLIKVETSKMKYFVSADIHGFYDEWMTSLENAGFNIENPEHIIIVCGDLFDRGRQSKEVIDFVLQNKEKIIYIKGNHEDLLEELIERKKPTIYDYHNGTSQTIVDLYPEWEVTEYDLRKIAKATRLQDVLALCQNYYETDNYIFVHSWIPIDNYINSYDPNWREASKDAWYKARWAKPLAMYKSKFCEPNKTIVFGHWHCSAFWNMAFHQKYDEFGEKSNFEPFITKEIIALDSCTAYSGKVNVVVIEGN